MMVCVVLISPSFGALGGMCLVIVTFPGCLHIFLDKEISSKYREVFE